LSLTTYTLLTKLFNLQGVNTCFTFPEPTNCEFLTATVAEWQALNVSTGIPLLTYVNINWSPPIDQPVLNQWLEICGIDTAQLCNEPLFPPAPEIDDGCDSTFIDLANQAALAAYQQYYDNLVGEFEKTYRKKCLGEVIEMFNANAPYGEYHYTLYYYDQGGNLVKTVPPAGIILVPDNDLSLVDLHRKTPLAQGPVYPAHTMSTTYFFNSFNKPWRQQTPDAGITEFWYDLVGRLVVSRNAEQNKLALKKYSYSKYDNLNRIIETGKNSRFFVNNNLMSDAIAENNTLLDAFLSPTLGVSSEVVSTYYDEGITGLSLGTFNQINLRNRVATSTYEDIKDSDPLTYQTATHYSYDIMGNVTSLLNENRNLQSISHHLKRVNYDFDLISGKVNRVTYQPNQPDQFIHEYEYDADNRIISVNTSTDGSLWQNDAYYRYHYHGPLARMELGQYRVQGVDYFYTLQGWMKGANSSVSNFEHDMYHDGEPGSLYGQVARDAYAFTLNYYDVLHPENATLEDYLPINASDPEADDPNVLFKDEITNPSLFNGNIRNAIYNLSALKNIYGYAYKYDQLNRLKNMNTYDGLSWTSNEWQPGTTNAGIFNEAVNYDPNGNILGYARGGDNPSLSMDDLSYNYYPGTNKLQSVFDPVSSSNYPNDIDDNTTFNSGDNYEYDDIGNLTNDHSEGLTVTWYNNGKIKEVINANTNVTINYMYDPAGNRVQKTVNDNSSITHTYYQRDAQGNTLAVYTQKDDDLYLREQHIYGSSRIGMYLANRLMYCTSCPPIDNSLKAITKIGAKRYELTNHLGNVLTTITDKKLAGIGPNGVEYYPQITQATEYYPFGMQMPNRNYVLSGIGDYRYGFNGHEKDNEIKGEGNCYTTEYRQYDSRLARWNSIDPLFANYPSWGTYSFPYGNPILYIDPDGRGATVTKDKNENGKTTGVTVSAKIYIYGDHASPDVAKNFQKRINENYNTPSKLNSNGNGVNTSSAKVNWDQNGKDYDVKFNISVEFVSESKAIELAKNNESMNVNFLKVYDNGNPGNGSEVFLNDNGDPGNSGQINVSQDQARGGTSLLHEVGHLLGYKSNTDAHDKTHYYGPVSGVLNPIMAVKGNLSLRRVTTSDINGLNLLNNLFGTPKQSKTIGDGLTNSIR